MSTSNKVGRPSELTPELQEQICDFLRDAVNIETACQMCGIAKSTYYGWLSRGESGEEPFAEFLDAATRARAKAKLTLQRVIDAAAEKDWRAAAWRLEHGWPQEFSKQRQSNEPQQTVVEDGSVPRLRTLIAREAASERPDQAKISCLLQAADEIRQDFDAELRGILDGLRD